MKIGDKIGWSLAIKVGESISEKSDISYPEHLILTYDGAKPILSADGTKVLTYNGWVEYPENMILTYNGTQPILSADGTKYLTTDGFV